MLIKDECPICLEYLYNINNDIIDNYTTNCNHTFHLSCLKICYKINNNCPLCRQKIDNPNETTIFNIYILEGIIQNKKIYKKCC